MLQTTAGKLYISVANQWVGKVNVKLNEKGYALLTVFLISLISMVLISIMFYALTNHTRMSGQNKSYLTELEAAKGVSEYIMASLRNDSLTCNSNGNCNANDSIDILGGVCTALGKANCNGISATYLSRINETSSGATIIAVQVTSSQANGSAKAIVEFVYKVF